MFWIVLLDRVSWNWRARKRAIREGVGRFRSSTPVGRIVGGGVFILVFSVDCVLRRCFDLDNSLMPGVQAGRGYVGIEN